MKASASCLHISYGSVDSEPVLFAMTLRGAGEPSRATTVPVGASFSSPELPLELGFPIFALDSKSVGFPLNISFLDFPAEIRLEIYRLLFMNHEHKCVWLDGDNKGGEGSYDSDDSDDSAADSDDSEEDSGDEEEEVKPAQPAKAKRKAEEVAAPAAKKSKTAEAGADEGQGGNLFVGNLSWNVDEEWLTREFEEFGELSGVRIITDRNTGRSKG